MMKMRYACEARSQGFVSLRFAKNDSFNTENNRPRERGRPRNYALQMVTQKPHFTFSIHFLPFSGDFPSFSGGFLPLLAPVTAERTSFRYKGSSKMVTPPGFWTWPWLPTCVFSLKLGEKFFPKHLPKRPWKIFFQIPWPMQFPHQSKPIESRAATLSWTRALWLEHLCRLRGQRSDVWPSSFLGILRRNKPTTETNTQTPKQPKHNLASIHHLA